jgi:1-acyl-sn-glycerol-3-phosphate acyltransferase
MEIPATWLHTPDDGGAPLPGWLASPAARLARTALQNGAFAGLDLLAPTTVEGRDHLAGLHPPALLVANHASHLDSMVVLSALPAAWRARTLVAAAADYFFTRPLLGNGAMLVGQAFPFARQGDGRAALAACAGLLRAGRAVLIYPEGTRSTDGRLGRFHSGVGLLAVELGVPVIPVGLTGLHSVLPRERRLPRPGAVRVCFGPPLHFAPGTSYRAAARVMASAVDRLYTPPAPPDAPRRGLKGATHAGPLPY